MQEPSINVISLLIFIGAVLGLFLACALVFMRRGNRRANLLLAALLLAFTVALIDGFMHVSNYYSRYPRLLGLAWPAKFLFGPFLYFYVKELSSSRRMVFSWTQLLHLLPMTAATLLIVHHISAYGNAPGWACAPCAAPFSEGGQIHARDIAFLLQAIQKIIYYIFSFLLIRSYGSRIKQSFSSLEKISLSWLRTLLILFVSLCFLSSFLFLFAASLGIYRESGYFIYLGMAGITYVMAFKAVLQPEIFSRLEVAHQAELIRTNQIVVPAANTSSPGMQHESNGVVSRAKYQKSFLTDERAAEISRQLLELMESKKPYLEPELTLLELADKLSESPHNISQVFNREMNKSFFDFVNEYRVREAKMLLSDPQHGHYSIFGIALDAGFNSKSAFYAAFGKHAEMTPSEFRKQQQLARSQRDTAPTIQGSA